jgi:hypothetical protein
LEIIPKTFAFPNIAKPSFFEANGDKIQVYKWSDRSFVSTKRFNREFDNHAVKNNRSKLYDANLVDK